MQTLGQDCSLVPGGQPWRPGGRKAESPPGGRGELQRVTSAPGNLCLPPPLAADGCHRQREAEGLQQQRQGEGLAVLVAISGNVTSLPRDMVAPPFLLSSQGAEFELNIP